EFSTMIECKAWNHPIEKDIVSKVNYVVRDLGLNKGIIVSLAGCRIGAEQAAKELGIDLWDGYEIEKRLGQVVVAELRGSGTSRRTVRGLPPTVTAERAGNALRSHRSGLLRKEELQWTGLIWLPLHRLIVSVSNTKRRRFGSDQLTNTRLSIYYEALS